MKIQDQFNITSTCSIKLTKMPPEPPSLQLNDNNRILEVRMYRRQLPVCKGNQNYKVI